MQHSVTGRDELEIDLWVWYIVETEKYTEMFKKKVSLFLQKPYPWKPSGAFK